VRVYTILNDCGWELERRALEERELGIGILEEV
jgi:hypothetical protein